MSLYPYNSLIDAQDAITLAHLTSCMSVNDGTWLNPAAGWLTSFANYGFLTTGRRLHGDNQPRDFINSLVHRGIDPAINSTTLPGGPASLWYNPCVDNYWNLINCWAVIVGEASNTCTNAWNSPVSGTTYYDDYGHSGWTNMYLGNFKNLHNALMPMQTVDASDVVACMATCMARLFNPAGAAFDAPPKILASIGIDNKFNGDPLGGVGGVLEGAAYLPGLGGSASKMLPADGSPIRLTFSTLRTTGTVVGNAFNSVWTDDPTHIPYLTEAEMAANLPVLKFNSPA